MTALAKQNPRERVHEVRRGETLSHIARRYEIELRTLCRANGITADTPIRPGQRLLVSSKRSLPREPSAAKRGAKADSKPKRAKKTKNSVRKTSAAPKSKKRLGSAKKKRRSVPTYRVDVARKYWRKNHQLGLVDLVGPMGKWSGYVVRGDGSLSPGAKRGFQKAMISRRTGEARAIDPRLIELVTRASDRFGGRRVHIISGYRPKRVNRFTPHSKHADGKAIDFRIEGVPNEELRDYLRGIANVGVGYYPNSTHVHLDVRSGSAYWVDYSKPGKPPQYSRPDSAPRRAGADPGAGGGKSSKPKKRRSRPSRVAAPQSRVE